MHRGVLCFAIVMLCLLCSARELRAQSFSVTIHEPSARLADDLISIRATVSPPSTPLNGMTAVVDTVSVALAPSGTSWVGTMDISSLPQGPLTLVVTAENTAGDMASASRMFTHDHPPSLILTSPSGPDWTSQRVHVDA